MRPFQHVICRFPLLHFYLIASTLGCFWRVYYQECTECVLNLSLRSNYEQWRISLKRLWLQTSIWVDTALANDPLSLANGVVWSPEAQWNFAFVHCTDFCCCLVFSCLNISKISTLRILDRKPKISLTSRPFCVRNNPNH